jgi:hypothetical protein
MNSERRFNIYYAKWLSIYKSFRRFKLMDILRENLLLLNKFEVSKSLYKSAFNSFLKKEEPRATADLFRLSIEVFLKELLKNKKTLENNITDLGKYLDEIKLHSEVRNSILKIANFYKHYQNTYIKHPNFIEEFELDWIVNQTGLLIRTLLLKTHKIEVNPFYVKNSALKEIVSGVYSFLKHDMRAQEYKLLREKFDDFSFDVKISTIIGPGTPRPQFYIYEMRSISFTNEVAIDIREKLFRLINENAVTTTHQRPYLIFIFICAEGLSVDEVEQIIFNKLSFNMEIKKIFIKLSEIKNLKDKLKQIVRY